MRAPRPPHGCPVRTACAVSRNTDGSASGVIGPVVDAIGDGVMLTAPSSAIVISLEPKQWQKGEFEAWRETASRGALADPCISHAAKSAFHFILWHVNREKGGWTLKLETIAAGTAMGSIRHARRGVAELESHGYLKRKPRPGRSNFYSIPLLRADRSVRGGRTDSSGVVRTGRTDSSAVTSYTSESYLGRKGDFRRRRKDPKEERERKEAQATLERYRREALAANGGGGQ